MIYFIGQKADLSEIRSEIFENTLEILRLFEKRAELSRQIGKIKNVSGSEIRDRTREKEVFRASGIRDAFTSGILNYLFEFSIDFQCNRNIEINWVTNEENGEEYRTTQGDSRIIELVAGIILGSLGQIIFSPQRLPNNLEIGFSIRGSHIVKGECAEPKCHKLALGRRLVGLEAFIVYNGEIAELGIRADTGGNISEGNLEVIF